MISWPNGMMKFYGMGLLICECKRVNFITDGSMTRLTLTGALTNLLLCLHSWMWSEMWVAVSWCSKVNSFVSVSNLISNWKFFRNSVAKAPKVFMAARGNSIYHLVELPVRVRGNSRSRTLPSTMELDIDHKLKVVMCVAGSSPCFPSNFGMSEGILCSTGGQSGLWLMGSLVSL